MAAGVSFSRLTLNLLAEDLHGDDEYDGWGEAVWAVERAKEGK